MRVLLIFDVFLPELVAQLRIRLFLRRFADLSRDDVVVPAVGDILGCSIRSATALARTASGTATAAGARAGLIRVAPARMGGAGALSDGRSR